MPLVLPTPEELDAHKVEVTSEQALQQASDLFTIATGISDQPTDLMEQRLVKQAILDMAWFLQDDHENFEAKTSPFQSERIGSYSYVKAQATKKLNTGVPGFDMAVDYFKGLEDSIITMDSEWVFLPGYRTYHKFESATSTNDPGRSIFWDDTFPTGLVDADENWYLGEDGFPVVEFD
jgi:hypothetical protein